jgi:hypothetical protein
MKVTENNIQTVRLYLIIVAHLGFINYEFVSKYKEESFVKMKEILTKKYKTKWNSEVCPLMKSLETEESFQLCQDLLLEEILYVLLKTFCKHYLKKVNNCYLSGKSSPFENLQQNDFIYYLEE